MNHFLFFMKRFSFLINNNKFINVFIYIFIYKFIYLYIIIG